MAKFLDIFKSLSKKTQNSLIFLFLIIFLIVFLEALAIGLIVPVITLLLNPDGITLPMINLYLDYNFKNILLIFSIIIVFYLLKNLILIIFEKKKFLKTNEIESYITNIVLGNYLNLPYEKILEKNTSEILRDVSSETVMFVRRYLTSSINLVLESLVIFFILLILFINSFESTLVISIVISSSAYIIYKRNKEKLYRIGVDRRKLNKKIIQHINEIFNSIREIIVYDKKEKIIKIFQDDHKKLLTNIQQSSFYSVLPRIILEVILIFVLFIIVLINLDISNPQKLISTLALFAAAAFRLFPSVSRILLALQNIKYSQASTDFVSDQIKNIFKDKLLINTSDFKTLKFKQVNFNFKNKKIFVNTEFQINKNDKIFLSGASGSGKTTLINLILGFLKPSEGQIIFNNNTNNSTKIYTRVSYVPQNIYLLDESIKKNITFFDEETNNEEKIQNLIDLCMLRGFVKDLEKGIETNIGENAVLISGGQKQRIGIARALYKKNDILILDEATNAIDLETEKMILENILKLDKTVVFVSHKSNLKNLFQKRYKIFENKIIQD